MTEKDHCCCEQPENLKDSPEQCTTEQVRICHGHEITAHPCTCAQEKKDDTSK